MKVQLECRGAKVALCTRLVCGFAFEGKNVLIG